MEYKQKEMLDFVFVVLVYRNTKDLEDFFATSRVNNSHVIVVNSFYDKETEHSFRMIAEANFASFISVENKGYGYGNNIGIEYAKRNFNFKFIVISNADINIKQLDISSLDNFQENSIVAPEILTLANKMQNPCIPYHFDIVDHLKYVSFKYNIKPLRFFLLAIRKVLREIFLKGKHSKLCRIYAAHGSFIIVSQDVTRKLASFFNDDMFLFVEEDHLAKVAKNNNVNVWYNPSIKVLHKEDGSVGLAINNNYRFKKDSFIKFYRYWYK